MSEIITEKCYYVYLLLDPRSGILTPFYVGKGKGGRYKSHMSAKRLDRNNLKNSIIKRIRAAGLSVVPFIYKEGLSNDEALFLETQLISRFGRRNLQEGILSNLTDGGDGAHRVIWTEEMREKKRQRMSGAGSPTFGVGHTEAARAKMSASHKNRAKAGLITRHSEEWKQKLREDNKGGAATRKRVLKLLPNASIVEVFESMTAAAKSVGWRKGNFGHALVKDGSLPKDDFFYRYEGSTDITPNGVRDANKLLERRARHERGALSGKTVTKTIDGAKTTYESLKSAARDHPHLKYATMWYTIKNGTVLDGAYWSYR